MNTEEVKRAKMIKYNIESVVVLMYREGHQVSDWVGLT